MKRFILLTLVTITFSCSTPNPDYDSLIGEHISNDQIQELMDKLGSDYKYDDYYGKRSYFYESQGVELAFTDTDTLRALHFLVERVPSDIALPGGIENTDTRRDVLKKLGEPDKNFVSPDEFTSFYQDMSLDILYKSPDTSNLNNGVKAMSVSRMNRNRELN